MLTLLLLLILVLKARCLSILFHAVLSRMAKLRDSNPTLLKKTLGGDPTAPGGGDEVSDDPGGGVPGGSGQLKGFLMVARLVEAQPPLEAWHRRISWLVPS